MYLCCLFIYILFFISCKWFRSEDASCTCNTSDLYSGVGCFEPRHGHRLSHLTYFGLSLSIFKQIPLYYLKLFYDLYIPHRVQLFTHRFFVLFEAVLFEMPMP